MIESASRSPEDVKRVNRQASEYLSFRSFYTGFEPERAKLTKIRSFDDLTSEIRRQIGTAERPAILLSGGMDSAILVPFMPEGSTAYTFTHPQIERDEVAAARAYADKFGLTHKVVQLDVDQYFEVMSGLMTRKGMPLSPAEPILHILALTAAADGHSDLVTGGGADTKQGGFAQFRKTRSLSKFEQKCQRAYLPPQQILKDGVDIQHVLRNYAQPFSFGQLIDFQRFMAEIGTERFAFNNAIESTGLGHIAPMNTVLCPYNAKQNAQTPKAYIQAFYREIYGVLPPKKQGLQKPKFALQAFRPARAEFVQDFDYESLEYTKKFLVYSLERFMNEVGFS